MASPALPFFPPPWTCKCHICFIPLYNSSKAELPANVVYAPLEAGSEKFSSPGQVGAFKGSLGFVQVIRYTDTPVGTYDELVFAPGYFEGGDSGIKKNHVRITGIWVSSEVSLLNGRRNWNIPKHLARFEFTLSDPNDPTSMPVAVKVFNAPLSSEKNSGIQADLAEQRPFFTAKFQSISYLPAIPFHTSWMKYLGFPSQLLQPPLPAGEKDDVEVGTDDWKLAKGDIGCRKMGFTWVDMRQEGTNDAKETSDLPRTTSAMGEDNWWPGLRRWRLGMWAPNSVLELGKPEILNGK